jgi:CBS domain-containing protein
LTAPKDTTRNVLPLRSTLREVLERLNAGVQGVILMVDAEGRMRGLFTDGDARRALLGGAALEAPAEQYMNDSNGGHRPSTARRAKKQFPRREKRR